MSLPTFKHYLAESLADLAKGKGEPARATYPKTNMKRFIDNWNEKLGAWVQKGLAKGYEIKKRQTVKEDEVVLDMIDGDKLVSTAVVSGSHDIKSGDHTFDFYNMQDPHSNSKYRVLPENMLYVKAYVWQPISGEGLHHSDQRNIPTDDSARDMANSRVRDGEEPSWAAVMKSKPKRRT